MSGLEGIAGLSLACNVMQLISFGHEAISMCRRIHESGSPEPGLSEHAEGLKAVCDSLEKSLGKRPTPGPAAAPAATRAPTMEKRLLELAAKCVKNARDLEEEMKFLSPIQPGKLGALVAVPKILWRKRRLERLRRSLNEAQKDMDTSILERLFARAEALYQANIKGFSDLSKELRRFIADHATTGSVLQIAVETHVNEIQDHITMESSRTQEAIKSHLSLELSSQEISVKNHVSSSAQGVQDALSQRMTSKEDSEAREQCYQQLLRSLKYPGMNERSNQISQTHPGTFRWIFSDKLENSDSDSGHDRESDWLTEDESSTYSDDSTDLDTTSIRSEHFSKSSGSSMISVQSLPVYEPQPWDSFADWLKDDTRKVYWICGKPGSGKSTLVKHIESNASTIGHCESAIRCISHYLWRPGTFMQQSVKGLLCSLLHQVLVEDESNAMKLLERQPSISMKDAYTDWDARELEATLSGLIRSSGCVYLMLLDGLDEVADTPDEGISRLLGLIDDLVAANQVKVCVSSRPEPALKRVLEKHPMLKIQDLTNRDIRLLTQDRFEGMGIDLDNDVIDNLSKLICGKAEGVFIWVVLVLNSLERGLDNYDDMDTLYSRVESLPKDLTKLYKEMWSRMKEDSDLYRRKTVLLFYMAMELRASLDGSDAWEDMDNLLGLVISTDDEMLKSFTARHEIPDMELLWKKWHGLGKALPAMCAGLLDITEPEEAFTSHGNNESRFQPWGRTGIRFTHRTAIDFIRNSVEGQELFGAYVPNQDEILTRAIKTSLMLLMIRETEVSAKASTNNTNMSPIYKMSRQSYLSFIPFRHLAKISSRRNVHNLLSFSHECLMTMGLSLEIWGSALQSAKAHDVFLAAVVGEVGLADWAEETLQVATAGVEEVVQIELLALRAACEGIADLDWCESQTGGKCRLSVIQKVLRKYSTSQQGLNDSPVGLAQQTCSRDISAAWRCLLSHTLEQVMQWERVIRLPIEEEQLQWWSTVLKAIHSFLSAKVLENFMGQKYIICIRPRRGGIKVIWEKGFPLLCGDILFEVNDTLFLALIIEAAQKVLGSTPLTKQMVKLIYFPIAIPKLLVGDELEGPQAWFEFNEILQDGSMNGQRLLKLIQNGKIQNFDGLTSKSGRPCILQVRKLVGHRDYSSALRVMGYEFGIVNKNYRCCTGETYSFYMLQ